MRLRVKKLHRAMQRTFRALGRYDRNGQVDHLVKAVLSVGRTLNRSFGSEAARGGPGCNDDISPLPEGTDLRDEVMYCSDRWGMRRYLRVRRFLQARGLV